MRWLDDGPPPAYLSCALGDRSSAWWSVLSDEDPVIINRHRNLFCLSCSHSMVEATGARKFFVRIAGRLMRRAQKVTWTKPVISTLGCFFEPSSKQSKT
jgi:hypothetical protein